MSVAYIKNLNGAIKEINSVESYRFSGKGHMIELITNDEVYLVPSANCILVWERDEYDNEWS